MNFSIHFKKMSNFDIEGKLSEQRVGRELFLELEPEFIFLLSFKKMMKDIFVAHDQSAVLCLVS